jgi:hypothetical protein
VACYLWIHCCCRPPLLRNVLLAAGGGNQAAAAALPPVAAAAYGQVWGRCCRHRCISCDRGASKMLTAHPLSQQSLC